ncbi:Hypothetical protein PHPALM_109 [Phytophthora palmivora]|uniref:Uncharacterized protein n=1 Tax=Phytophthora palmivora TaxID=4796 RepID=A0A2P4YVM9_9STRA|nr:Hypothetical protein PHPALM_109 [Phytophthora palmivora]
MSNKTLPSSTPPLPNPSEVTYVSYEMIIGGEFDIDEALEVNLTTLDDNPDELTGLDSDGENVDGLDDWSSEEHDESSDRDADDNDVVVQPGIMFDEGFLVVVGGVDSLESISKTVLDDMATTGWTDPTTCTPYPYMSGPYEPPDPKVAFEDYPRLYGGPFGPTEDAFAAAATPSGACFYFMTPELWDDIVLQSNNYFTEKLNERVDGQYAKQIAREAKRPGYRREAKEDIRKKIKKIPDITARNLRGGSWVIDSSDGGS